MDKSKQEYILKEFEWSFSRSSGPGGQHVNTTDSKVQLCWNFQLSPHINLKQKNLIEKKLKNYIKRSHSIQLSCSTNRSREMNKKACSKKLFELLKKIAFKKEKKRIKTKPTRSSIEKRIQAKKTKSDVKKTRQKVKY